MPRQAGTYEIESVQVYCPHCDASYDPGQNGYETCHREENCHAPRTPIKCESCKETFAFPTIIGFNKFN